MNEDQFEEELYQEYLYFKYKDIVDKIKEIVNNEKITGIEAKLMIKDILEERKKNG